MIANNCLLSLACIICICVSFAAGLQCYSCVGSISGSTLASDLSCDPTQDNLVTCDQSEFGYNSSCYLLIAQTSFTYFGKTYRYTSFLRYCSNALADTNGCTDRDISGQKVDLPTIQGASFGKLKYRSCYCASDRCNDEVVTGDQLNQPNDSRRRESGHQLIAVFGLLTVLKIW